MGAAVPEMLALVTALSLDAFVAALAYGTEKVKIPLLSVLILAALSAGILMLSLLLGAGIGSWLPEGLTDRLGFLFLFLTGLFKLFDSSLKTFLRRLQPSGRRLSFSLAGARIILDIYADPEKANEEDREVLSPREACFLGLALSLDSTAAGLGAGVSGLPAGALFFLAVLSGLLAVFLGNFLGRRLALKGDLPLSFLSGGLLILLAVKRLF